MTKHCREIIDRIAEGEALEPEHEEHVATCLTCARTLETRDLIRATTERRNRVAPRPGFASRAAAGALERAARRRRRGGFALIGATVVAGALTVAFFMLDPQPMAVNHELARSAKVARAHQAGTPAPANDDNKAELQLLDLADTDGAMSVEADWDWLEEPLLPSRLLAERYGGGKE